MGKKCKCHFNFIEDTIAIYGSIVICALLTMFKNETRKV